MNDFILGNLKKEKKINIIQFFIMMLAVVLMIAILVLHGTVSMRLDVLKEQIGLKSAITINYDTYIDVKLVEKIKDINDVKKVYPILSYRTNVEVGAGLRSFFLSSVCDEYIRDGLIEIEEGRTVIEGEREILISKKVAKKDNINIGDTVDIILDNETVTMTVVGLYSQKMFMMMPYYEAYVSSAFLQNMLGIDECYNKVQVSVINVDERTILETIEKISRFNNGFTYETIYTQKNSSERDFESFSMLLWAVLTIFILISIYSIYNFTLTKLENSMSTIITIKMLGARNRWIEGLYVKENLIISLAGSLVGFFVGAFAGAGLCWYYANGDWKDIFPYYTFKPMYLIWGAIVSLLVPFAATVIPIRKTSRVSLVKAIRQSVIQENSHWSLKKRISLFVLGFVIISLNLIAAEKLVYVESELGLYTLMIIMGVFVVLAVILMIPLTVYILCMFLMKISCNTRGAEIFLSLRNTSTDYNNSSKIISFVAIGMMIIVALMGMFSSTEKSIEEYVDIAYAHDYIISYNEPDSNRINVIVENINECESVKDSTWLYVYHYIQGANKIRVFGINPEVYDSYSHIKIMGEDGARFSDLQTEKNSCFVSRQIIIENDYNIGDTIIVSCAENKVELKIAGVFDSFVNDGRLIFANRDTIGEILDDEYEITIFANKADNVSNKEFETEILKSSPNVKLSFADVPTFKASWVEGVFNGTEIFYFMFLLIIIFTLFSVINNHIVAVRKRKKEIAIIHSLGAKDSLLNKEFIIETIIIIVIAFFVGTIGSYSLLRIFVKSFSAIFNTDLSVFYPIDIALMIYFMFVVVFVLIDICVVRGVIKADKSTYIKNKII